MSCSASNELKWPSLPSKQDSVASANTQSGSARPRKFGCAALDPESPRLFELSNLLDQGTFSPPSFGYKLFDIWQCLRHRRSSSFFDVRSTL